MNPFIFGVVVDNAHYCPRLPLEKRLKERLVSGQNVYLIGPRRVGKTSLVERVGKRNFKNRYFRVDFMTVKTPDEATEWILNAWLNYERQKRAMASAIEYLASLNLDVSILGNRIKVESGKVLERVSFDHLFGRLDQKPKRNQPPMVLFFDEFQALLDLNQGDRFEFLGRLRKGIQHLSHVRVVFAGSVRHSVHEIFQDPASPFFNAAEPIEVGPIEPRDRFHEFLQKKFVAGNRTPNGRFWEEVEGIAEGNPSDTQRLCAAVWETSRPGDDLDETAVDQALGRIFEHEHIMNSSIIEQSTALQKKCLVGIAVHGGDSPTSGGFLEQIRHKSSASVLKALNHFVKLGILTKTGSAYRFTNPYFRQWLIRKQP